MNGTNNFSRRTALQALAAGLLLLPSLAGAETAEFGGEPLGQNSTPPLCQITYPVSTRQPFFIQWNCSDDVSDPADITTELWISRPNDPRYTKVDDFLGFPASVQVNAALLGATSVAEGLPLNFRLIARAAAGATSVSPVFTVSGGSTSISKCDLSIVTQGTTSTGSTTGVPSSSVLLRGAAVTTQRGSNGQLTVRTTVPATASTCEIDSICEADSLVAFSVALGASGSSSSSSSTSSSSSSSSSSSTSSSASSSSSSSTSSSGGSSGGAATGELTVTPGDVSSDVSGRVTVNNGSVTAVDVRGTASVDGANAELRLSCQN